MARSLASKPNVTAPGGSYPFGRIKDDTGSNDGTPVDERVYGDFHQFFAKLMDAAALAYNNQPENNADGFQYIQALQTFIQSFTSPKVSKAGDVMTGNLTIPNGAIAGHAINKGQLDAAIAALINGAPGALDALNELAAALGNDANFSATVTNLIAIAQTAANNANANANTRVLKSGDTMTGPLIVPGVNSNNITLRTKKLDIGSWDMDTVPTKTLAHGIPNLYLIPHWISVSIIADDEGIQNQQVTNFISGGEAYAAGPSDDPTLVVLIRDNAGIFDNAIYDKTAGGYNRGWVFITYEA